MPGYRQGGLTPHPRPKTKNDPRTQKFLQKQKRRNTTACIAHVLKTEENTQKSARYCMHKTGRIYYMYIVYNIYYIHVVYSSALSV